MLTKEEIKKTDHKELQKELTRSRHEFVKIKLKLIEQSTKDSHKLKELKKYIAQILTAINSQKKSN